MPGKKSLVSPLESRKRLLIAESEINRGQMVEEWQAMVEGVHALAAQAKSIRTFASAGAVLVATVAAFRRGKTADPDAKPSRLRTLIRGAGLISSVWLALRSHGHDQKDK